MTRLHPVGPRILLPAGLATLALALAGPPVASAKVVATPIATYDREISIAAKGDDVAVVATPEGGAPTISIGHGTQAPTPAEGIAPGASGPVHFGTNAGGDTVLTYPRERNSVSELWVWNARTHREQRVAGTGSRDVIEGVMDRGNVAYARITGKTKSGFDTHRTLMYKPASGAARVLAQQGGHDLALGAGGVLQVVPSMASGDGLQTPILLQRVTLAGAVTTLRRVGVGEDFQQVLSPTFAAGGVQWLFTSLSGSTLYRLGPDGRVKQRRTGKVEAAIAYTSPSKAYAVRVSYAKDEELPSFDLVRLSGITFEPAK